VACKNVDHLKEHGGNWKLNDEIESPVVEAHSTPRLTKVHIAQTNPGLPHLLAPCGLSQYQRLYSKERIVVAPVGMG
jgi:hypothetical protein